MLSSEVVLVDMMLEHAPISAVRCGRDGSIEFANSQWLRRMEVSLNQAIGRRFNELVDTCSYDVMARIDDALSGEVVTYATVYSLPAIGLRHLEVVMMPGKGATGEIDCVLIFINDTTEKISLKSAKKDASDYLTALDAHAIVAVTDRQGVITWANDKFCAISQYSRAELYGKTHRTVNSGYHSKEFFAKLWRTIASGCIWQGEICNRAKDGSIYWVYSTIVPIIGGDGRPERYVAIRADITRLKRIEDEALRLSRYDFLTGLPNRRFLMEGLIHARRSSVLSGQFWALLSVDLDDFKKVNDYFGHAMGDELLKMAAIRLSSCLRDGDSVGRIGGDEFLIILENLGADEIEARERVSVVCSRVLGEMSEPYFLKGPLETQKGGIFSAVSLGVGVFNGDTIDVDELLTQVDLALYRAKRDGRNRCVFFSKDLQAEASVRQALESDLRDALHSNDLFLAYQMIVDRDRNVLGYEALLRWQRKEVGLVAPSEFIPIAEQTGLIVVIGQHVLELACRKLVEWSKNRETRNWTLSVNISARQIEEPLFFDDVVDVLRRTGADPGRLILEITESVLLVVASRHATEKLKRLKGLGIKIALDDFGTGYSSLSYLQQLPLDRLKIDKSFIANLTTERKDQGIVNAVLTLAAALEIDVVAEGVETEEQYAYLMAAGCPLFQGFLFGHPVTMR